MVQYIPCAWYMFANDWVFNVNSFVCLFFLLHRFVSCMHYGMEYACLMHHFSLLYSSPNSAYKFDWFFHASLLAALFPLSCSLLSDILLISSTQTIRMERDGKRLQTRSVCLQWKPWFFFLHLLTVRINVLHHLFCTFIFPSSFDLFVDILRSIYLQSTIY